MLFYDDDHRSVIVVAVAQCVLAVCQLIEVVFAPIPPVDVVKAFQIQDIFECLEDVGSFRTEVAAGEEVEECHRQFLAMAPLEVIDFVQARSAACFDLKE